LCARAGTGGRTGFPSSYKWVNRASFCTGSEGDDSLGYDFRVVTTLHEYLYKVKSALDEGGEFELTARELEIAGRASLKRKRCFRILYVPFVFELARWRVLPLSNPVSADTRNRFRVVRSGSVRYRFERRWRSPTRRTHEGTIDYPADQIRL
jgi:hypothetical protein